MIHSRRHLSNEPLDDDDDDDHGQPFGRRGGGGGGSGGGIGSSDDDDDGAVEMMGNNRGRGTNVIKSALQAPVKATVKVGKAGVKVGKASVIASVKVGKSAVHAPKQVLDTTTNMIQSTVGNSGALHQQQSPFHNSKSRHSRQAWQPRVTAEVIQLQLVIECRRLPKKDSFSMADAFCAIWEAPAGYTGSPGSTAPGAASAHSSGSSSKKKGPQVSRLPSRQEREVGRTEVIRENRNPVFTTTFHLDYKFQQEQTYVVRVYDEDLRYATDLKEHDFIGGCVFTLGELMGAPGCTIARPLQRSSHGNKAFVILTGHEIDESREVLEFRFSGQDLGLLETKKNQKAKEMLEKVNVAKTVMEKYDFYFRVETLNTEDQSWSVVWKSEVVKDNQNPTWDQARLPLQQLLNAGNNDANTPIKLTIWVWNRLTADDLVGFVETTVADLVQQARRGIPVLDVMQERKKFLGGTKLKKTGILKVLKAGVIQIPSLLQYLAGGCHLDCMVAVDCTAANGDNWRQEENLHYRQEDWWNDYQMVLHKVGVIFEAYKKHHHNSNHHHHHGNNGNNGSNDDNSNNCCFSLWGYGANKEGKADPFFCMRERIGTADELVEAYEDTFSIEHNPFFHLGSTAPLHQVIQTAMYRSIEASKRSGTQSYTTLVILTAGAMDDVQACIDAICSAAEDAPLSIAIIGLGPGVGTGFNDFHNDNSNHNSGGGGNQKRGKKDKHHNNAQYEEEESFAEIRMLSGNTRGGSSNSKNNAGGASVVGGRLRHSNGVPVARDMVHFAAVSDFGGNNTTKCVSEALRLVPEQFVQYFLNSGTKPLPPLAVPDFGGSSGSSSRRGLTRGQSQDSVGSDQSGNNSFRHGRGGGGSSSRSVDKKGSFRRSRSKSPKSSKSRSRSPKRERERSRSPM